jgi:hypothetical protein
MHILTVGTAVMVVHLMVCMVALHGDGVSAMGNLTR